MKYLYVFSIFLNVYTFYNVIETQQRDFKEAVVCNISEIDRLHNFGRYVEEKSFFKNGLIVFRISMIVENDQKQRFLLNKTMK